MTHLEISLQFLDTSVYRNGERFAIDLFIKPTDRNNLLKDTSDHPKADSIPAV